MSWENFLDWPSWEEIILVCGDPIHDTVSSHNILNELSYLASILSGMKTWSRKYEHARGIRIANLDGMRPKW